MATPAGRNGAENQMPDNKSIDKGKQPVRPPEDSPRSTGGEQHGSPDPGLLDVDGTPPGRSTEFIPAHHYTTSSGSGTFAGRTHPGIRNLGLHDPKTAQYDTMEDDSSEEEEEEEECHSPRLDTSFERPRHSSGSNSWSDQSISRSGLKEPMSAIAEEDSSEEEEEAAAVQTAQVGRMHSLKGKNGTPVITNRKFDRSGSGRSSSNSSGSNSGGASAAGNDKSGPIHEERIILAPRGAIKDPDADVEHYQVKLVPKGQKPYPNEEYRLHLGEKDLEESGEQYAVKMASRNSAPDLPEVVPGSLDEKELAVPTDDKIPRPRHDEKIPAPKFDDKIVSPHSDTTRGTNRNDSQFSTNQADEKLLPLYTGFEDNLKGGDYFVGTIDNLSGSTVTNGRRPLKIAADGSILIPQPSDDPNDPLNWSWLKKHSTYWAILLTSFFSDLVITYGIILFNNQGYEWSRSTIDISRSVAGAILMQAPGALLVVPMVQRFGRLPILFWSQFFTLLATLAATYTRTFVGFTAMRAIQGFFAAAPQVIGLSVIYDLFFFHERARKINTWICLIFLGPYAGVFVSTLVVDKLDWRDTFAILCGFYGFSLVAVAFFAEETLFNARNPWPGSGGAVERIMYVTGFVGAMQKQGRPTLWQSWKHVCHVIIRPYVIVPTFALITIMALWLEGIISIIPKLMKPLPYQFTTQNMAFLCFAPMLGIIVAEIWGRWFNDFLAAHYIKRHAGHFKPEYRLWAVYPAWLLGIVGLVLMGQAFAQQLQWGVVAISWALVTFSALGVTVAITAYLLDILPFHAAASAAWLVFFRSIGGFAAPFMETKWIKYTGVASMFGIQAACWGACISFILIAQVLGPKWRAKFPAPKPKRQNF